MGSIRTPMVWRQITRNVHVGSLDGNDVASVERPQKNRKDGTKFPWSIIVLHDRWSWSKTFDHHDPRDLESSMSAAEARARWAISVLYSALRSGTP